MYHNYRWLHICYTCFCLLLYIPWSWKWIVHWHVTLFSIYVLMLCFPASPQTILLQLAGHHIQHIMLPGCLLNVTWRTQWIMFLISFRDKSNAMVPISNLTLLWIYVGTDNDATFCTCIIYRSVPRGVSCCPEPLLPFIQGATWCSQQCPAN